MRRSFLRISVVLSALAIVASMAVETASAGPIRDLWYGIWGVPNPYYSSYYGGYGGYSSYYGPYSSSYYGPYEAGYGIGSYGWGSYGGGCSPCGNACNPCGGGACNPCGGGACNPCGIGCSPCGPGGCPGGQCYANSTFGNDCNTTTPAGQNPSVNRANQPPMKPMPDNGVPKTFDENDPMNRSQPPNKPRPQPGDESDFVPREGSNPNPAGEPRPRGFEPTRPREGANPANPAKPADPLNDPLNPPKKPASGSNPPPAANPLKDPPFDPAKPNPTTNFDGAPSQNEAFKPPVGSAIPHKSPAPAKPVEKAVPEAQKPLSLPLDGKQPGKTETGTPKEEVLPVKPRVPALDLDATITSTSPPTRSRVRIVLRHTAPTIARSEFTAPAVTPVQIDGSKLVQR